MTVSTEKELNRIERMAREFAGKELASDREVHDKYPFSPFFESVVEKAESVDFFHAILPEELGGAGLDLKGLCVILDRVCREDSSLGGIVFTHTAAQEILLSAERGDVLCEILSGEGPIMDRLLAFPSYTDPGARTDIPRAHAHDGSYRINGRLSYLVLGDQAGFGLVPAVVDGSEDGYAFFLVELNTKEIRKSKPVHSLGLHACPGVDVELTDAPGRLVGSVGLGHELFRAMADKMNLCAAAMSTGVMKGAYEEALSYAKQRSQGGRRIIDWSEVKMIFSGMAIKIRIAEMCVEQACKACDANRKNWPSYARAAAIHLQEMACDLTNDGIQLLGGAGYMEDYGQEKRFRDAKQMQSLLGSVYQRKVSFY